MNSYVIHVPGKHLDKPMLIHAETGWEARKIAAKLLELSLHKVAAIRQNNPAREALSRAVDKAIANGAPIITEKRE